jgi:hypothetical protein
MPPNVSFADMGGADGIRKIIVDQIQAGVKAGIFQPADFTGVRKLEVQIPTRDGSSLRGVVYCPESAGPGPLFVYFHGGGFVFGFPEAYETAFEILTKELGFTVLGVAYRLAPEAVFPTAANDAWDSLKWVRSRHPCADYLLIAAGCRERVETRRRSFKRLHHLRKFSRWKPSGWCGARSRRSEPVASAYRRVLECPEYGASRCRA